MKKVYLQPRTEDVPLHIGELMIPGVIVDSNGQTKGSPTEPAPIGAPIRLSKMYI